MDGTENVKLLDHAHAVLGSLEILQLVFIDEIERSIELEDYGCSCQH